MFVLESERMGANSQMPTFAPCFGISKENLTSWRLCRWGRCRDHAGSSLKLSAQAMYSIARYKSQDDGGLQSYRHAVRRAKS